MPVHVERLTSEVTPEPEGSPAEAAGTTEWEEVENHRRCRARLVRDRARISAEDFDD